MFISIACLVDVLNLVCRPGWSLDLGHCVVFLLSCFGKRDEVRPDGPLGLYADFTFLPIALTVEPIKVDISKKRKEMLVAFDSLGRLPLNN